MRPDAVTVLVPVWNRCELLEKLLAGLAAQTGPPSQILVVDNGSTDGSAALAESRGARVLRMGSNAGFAKAVNAGIRECRTPLLAIVNSDVEPAPDWLERLLPAFDDPRCWFATGKIFSAAERDRLDGTFDLLSRGACAWRAGAGRRDGPEFSLPRPIHSAPFTAALFRAELFRRAGLLDEAFGSYLEDVEFGLRCAESGFAGRYVPEALAWHAGSASLGRWHPEVVRLIARNQLLLVARHYPRGPAWRLAWPLLAGQLLWGLVALRHGAGWAWLRGKSAGVRFLWRTGEQPSTGGSRIVPILSEQEREIRHIQQKTGFDLFWRLYFLFTGGGAN